jgi:hypothetical protein
MTSRTETTVVDGVVSETKLYELSLTGANENLG